MNCFIEKNFDIKKTQTGVVTFGTRMTSSHQRKNDFVFFVRPKRSIEGILPVDQLAQSGVQNMVFFHTSRRFLKFDLKREGKWPTVSPLRDFSGFYKRISDRGHVPYVPFA